jgi:hypothetical protein
MFKHQITFLKKTVKTSTVMAELAIVFGSI